ncbi:hypothetical protein [Novosphingobium jiangmenense]|uniref:Uncharacterized protein n=1 Tax=Novosphingobium jiangmenense TaxID=2791981 RepID=A0ABS0HE71_9SPHN|nr:hypothetical protein [Novosphingobium jiangmenense]MBF9150569.1 hypothetical protein [Novosphingobium jiangmenense]
MRRSSRLKGSGYLVSSVSVVLLGIPALKSAKDEQAMLLAIIAGMALSIVGMALRWRSHRVEATEE